MPKKAVSREQKVQTSEEMSDMASPAGRFANKRPSRYWSELPPLVQTELSRLSFEDRLIFDKMYGQQAKSIILAYVMWLLCGLHHGYQGRWGKQIVFWLSCFIIIGFIWWLLDFVGLYGDIRKHNQECAVAVLRDIKQVRI